MISDSCSVDSSSPNRRSYQVEFHVSSPALTAGKDKFFWFDRYLRAYIGIFSLREQKIIWYRKGTFAFSETNFSYDPSNQSVSLTCPDLMSLLNGDLSGRMDGLSFTISQGQDIRTSLIGILSRFGFTKYRLDIPAVSVPYDLEFSANGTAYDMITKLMEFLVNYECFFDIDGVFVVQRRACYTNDIPVLTDALLSRLLISETYKQNFTNVKNCIQVYGHEFDSTSLRYTETCSYQASSNLYTATFPDLAELTDYQTLSIRMPAANKAGCRLKINHLPIQPILTEYEKELPANTMKADTSYVFLYKNKKLYYLGTFQIQAIYKNDLPQSPFSIQNVGREIWEVRQGGEYEDILSDANAMERAMYECYLVSNTAETLNLTLVDIPWLDANQKLSYTLQNPKISRPYEWLVDSVSSSTLDGTAQVTLSRFFPDWSERFLTHTT